MKGILCFILGLAIGFAGHWYINQPKTSHTTAQTREVVRDGITNTEPAPAENRNVDKIKDELARTGTVIREKAEKAGEVIADAAADAGTTARIKGKLVHDSGLAALKIDVDTSGSVVTLSGTVSSPDQIAKAVDLALNTEGVQRVVSSLQVKP